MSRKIQSANQLNNQSANIDYSLLKNLAAHPDKKDESDTIALEEEEVRYEKTVDVFYVHPTTLTGKINGGYINASLNDEELKKKRMNQQ
jgi:hypothetical protein